MTGRARAITAGLAALLVAAACTGAAPAGGPTTTATAEPQAELAAVQELTVAAGRDDYRTDGKRNLTGMFPLNANIYETLVTLSPTYQVEPGLATKWEFRAPNTYRFTLRSGVKFHDGTPLTAKDVKAVMDRVATAGGGTVGVDDKSAVVVDDLTVDITPKRTNLRALQQLVHPSWGIHKAGADVVAKPVGTGPFRFVSYTKGERIVVERNEDYWGAKPTLQKITFRFIPDPNTRVLALQAGEVQVAVEVPRESAKTVAAGDLRLVTSKPGAYEAIYVNIRGSGDYAIGKDKAVREAIAYAIDKKAVVENVWQNNAEISQTMIPPGILGDAASTVKGTARSVDRAKKLLDDAGWKAGADGVRAKDGKRLTLEMIVGYPTPEIHKPLPEFAQAQLKEVGIDLKIVTTPDTASYEKRLASGAQGHLWVEAGSQNDGNPCFLPELLFTSPVPGGDDEQNMYGNAFALGAKFDDAAKKCREATGVADVQKAAADMMKVLIDEEFVVIPLAGTFRLYGASSKVLDLVAHPAGVHQRWDKVRIRK
ncbi:MAG TPA: ABC transporter substrate-binding protein [Candidatus Limnocylindria bacterium]|nr:ABC transporter substrate-binding protein [Candidatus Limnocylindria bacterium]